MLFPGIHRYVLNNAISSFSITQMQEGYKKMTVLNPCALSISSFKTLSENPFASFVSTNSLSLCCRQEAVIMLTYMAKRPLQI